MNRECSIVLTERILSSVDESMGEILIFIYRRWIYVYATLNIQYIHTYIHHIYIYIYIYIYILTSVFRAIPQISCDYRLVCTIQRLHLCRRVGFLSTIILDMVLSNLIVKLRYCWSFGECGVPLHCHRSRVYSGPTWYHLIESNLLVKLAYLSLR